MGVLGQEQQWVAVQEKTFTKWSVLICRTLMLTSLTVVLFRLNSKINVREVAVNDLVTDLSDGVSTFTTIDWRIRT